MLRRKKIVLIAGMIIVGLDFCPLLNSFATPVNPQKYDSDAVCDFVLARLYEIEGEIKESKLQIKSTLTRADGENLHLNYSSPSMSIIYSLKDNVIYIDEASIRGDRILRYENSQKLARRLGIDRLNKENARFDCDMYDLSFDFARNELQQIKITHSLHE